MTTAAFRNRVLALDDNVEVWDHSEDPSRVFKSVVFGPHTETSEQTTSATEF